jgi:hypothetical protein
MDVKLPLLLNKEGKMCLVELRSTKQIKYVVVIA